jgi:2-polyprenyl-6-methoxyphenol hydroxylase-like FAD-dependent oxidoreductase
MRIAIVGYGIAGIAAAILLRRQGHDIAPFEQAEALGPVGGGLLLHGAGLRALGALGLREAAQARGAPVTRVQATSGRGMLMDLRYDQPALGIERGTLFGVLRAADGSVVKTGRRIVAVADGCLIDAHGEAFGPFDLIVAADGARSAVRAALPLIVRREHAYPWRAQYALLDDPQDQFAGRVVQRFDGTEHVSLWPVAPGRVALACRLADAARLPELSPLVPATLQAMDYREVRLRRFSHGRVVFLGDAAHAMSPQLGQGAGLALGDAAALAAALARYREVPRALAAYDAARRPLAWRYQRLSRLLTPVFQSGSRTLAAVRDLIFPVLCRLPPAARFMSAVLHGAYREP